MAADRLGPEAKTALSWAAAPGVERDVGMEQVADEVFADVQIAGIDGQHAGHGIPIVDQISIGGVVQVASSIAVTQPPDLIPGFAFRQFFAGVVKLVPTDEIDLWVLLKRLLWQHRDVSANQADLSLRILGLNRCRALDIVGQRRSTGVQNLPIRSPWRSSSISATVIALGAAHPPACCRALGPQAGLTKSDTKRR